MTEEEWVEMHNPTAGNPPGLATRKAFDEVWADKGWVLTDAQSNTRVPAQPEDQNPDQS